MAKAEKRRCVAFTVSQREHAWLSALARDAGDPDADTAAQGLIGRIFCEDMAAESGQPVAGRDGL